jgi:hypothetical protein
MAGGQLQYIDTFDSKKKMSGRIILEKFKAYKMYLLSDFLKGGL